jgi:hypothetical protein
MILIRSLVAAVALAACLIPATGYAQEPEPTPEPTPSPSPTIDPNLPVFTREEVWFHRANAPLANVGTIPGWNNTKPTAPHVLGGAGAVYAINNYSIFTSLLGAHDQHDPRFTPTFQGTHVGDLENMAVTAYVSMPVSLCATDIALAFDFRIDGQEILWQDQSQPSAGLMVEATSVDNLYAAKFALTNLYKALEDFDLDIADDKAHEIYLNFTTFYACQESVMMFDSAEAPSGAIFNVDDKTLKGYTKVDVFNPPPPLEGAALSAAAVGKAQVLR